MMPGVQRPGVQPVAVQGRVLAVHLLGDDDFPPPQPVQIPAPHVVGANPGRPGHMHGPRIRRTHAPHSPVDLFTP